MSRYRDRLQIIADILVIASRRARKTQIMYQANLSYRLVCRYLGEVLDAGMGMGKGVDGCRGWGRCCTFQFRFWRASTLLVSLWWRIV